MPTFKTSTVARSLTMAALLGLGMTGCSIHVGSSSQSPSSNTKPAYTKSSGSSSKSSSSSKPVTRKAAPPATKSVASKPAGGSDPAPAPQRKAVSDPQRTNPASEPVRTDPKREPVRTNASDPVRTGGGDPVRTDPKGEPTRTSDTPTRTDPTSKGGASKFNITNVKKNPTPPSTGSTNVKSKN